MFRSLYIEYLYSDHPPVAPSLPPPQSRTAVIAAAAHGSPETTELLLQHGAGVGDRTAEGVTALMLACAGGHVAPTEALLRAGAGVEEEDLTGCTPLHYVAHRNHQVGEWG